MNPVTHFLAGWVVANAAHLNRRERAVVTVAAVIPDIDGIGVVVRMLTRDTDNPLYWYEEYHHVLAHNLFFGLFVAGVCFMISKQRWKTAGFALFNFHLHLLGDLVSGRGPDGSIWLVRYLYPINNEWEISWQGQWELNAWPNYAVTLILLAVTF